MLYIRSLIQNWSQDAWASFTDSIMNNLNVNGINQGRIAFKEKLKVLFEKIRTLKDDDPKTHELRKKYSEMAMDLLRNDLSLVAKQVRVTQYKYYEEIKAHHKTTGQLSSCIEGKLPDNYPEKIGQILQQLLPAGSISGAPKPKTKALIQNIEESPRGFYTGIAGIFEGTDLDSCVMIRFLCEDGTYRCGGGITHLSDFEEEYNELIQKIYVPIL